MTAYVALLRAVNVGGTGKLAMADLSALCAAAGFRRVRTCLTSGNAVFDGDGGEHEIVRALEARLAAHMGRPVGVILRTESEMAAVLAGNPFADAGPAGTAAIFLPTAPPADALDRARGRADERMALGTREIYVAYGDAMGTSRLVIPAATAGTARNMNTVARLAKMLAAG